MVQTLGFGLMVGDLGVQLAGQTSPCFSTNWKAFTNLEKQYSAPLFYCCETRQIGLTNIELCLLLSNKFLMSNLVNWYPRFTVVPISETKLFPLGSIIS
jgi:hypothetical protein